jgi:hypothetical protein
VTGEAYRPPRRAAGVASDRGATLQDIRTAWPQVMLPIETAEGIVTARPGLRETAGPVRFAHRASLKRPKRNKSTRLRQPKHYVKLYDLASRFSRLAVRQDQFTDQSLI